MVSNTGLCVCINNFCIVSSKQLENVYPSNLKYDSEGILY